MRLAGLVPALLLALLLTQTLVASEEAPLGARTLLPGDNLIGWVGYPTTTEAFFEQIPEAELVYTWDAKLSRYRFAVRGFEAGLSMIEPGMGLIVRISGEEPVMWDQPTAADGERLTLEAGPNLVAWTGPSGTPLDLAVRSIGQSLTQALYWIPETKEFGIFKPDAKTTGEVQPKLRRGDALWVYNKNGSTWLQPSGDRALHPLGPPPDHIRWYRSFDKYLDADGLAIISSDSVADEALFRAAAIADEMLVNRPDIRETLVRQRVHIVIVGESEETYDLAPFRQFRGNLSLESRGTGGPRGFGPTDYTPILFPEENLLCYGNNSYRRSDISIHEFAHAIDYALSLGTSRGNFGSSLARAYRSALDSGLWEDTYAARNTAEYWAGGVQTWLGVDGGYSSPIRNRLHLLEYASPIAQLIVDTLGDFQVDSSCHSADSPVKGATRKYAVHGQVTDHLGEPPLHARISLQGTSNSRVFRSTSSWPDGGYGLFALPRDYTMRMSIDGCRMFYASSGPTPDSLSAEAFSLTDQDLNIDIQLEDPICTIAVSGVVLDAKGEGVEDLYLTVYGAAGKSWEPPRAGGAFKVRFPNEGHYYLRINYYGCEYVYDGDGLVRGPRPDLLFDAHQLAETELELRLPRGACSGTIVGNVLDEDGNPLQRARAGLYLPSDQFVDWVAADGSFRVWVDLPSNPILEVSAQGCRAYFGSDGLTLNVDEVTPFDLTNEGITELEIRIPADFCDSDLMMES